MPEPKAIYTQSDYVILIVSTETLLAPTQINVMLSYTACLVELLSCNDQTITSRSLVSLQYGLPFTRQNYVIKSLQVLPSFLNIRIARAPNQLNGRQ